MQRGQASETLTPSLNPSPNHRSSHHTIIMDSANEVLLSGHQGRVFQFQFHPTLPGLGVSCGEDGTSRIWKKKSEYDCSSIGEQQEQSNADEEEPVDEDDCENGGWELEKTISGDHGTASEVLRVCWGGSPTRKGFWLASAGANGKICLYDDKYKHIGSLNLLMDNNDSGDGQCYGCQIIGVNHLLTASDNLAILWDVERQIHATKWKFTMANCGHRVGGERNPGDMAYVFDSKAEPEHGCCRGQSSHLFATALSDGTVRVVDMLSKDVVATLKGPEGCHLTAVDWSAHRPILVVCSGNGSIGLWDRRMWANTRHITAHRCPAFGTCFLDDDRTLLSWSSDETVRAWDILHSCSDDKKADQKWGFHTVDYPVYYCAASIDDEPILAIAGGKSEPDHDNSHGGCCEGDHVATCPVHLLPIPKHSANRSSDDDDHHHVWH